jgi:hypothetical protein
LILDLVIIDSIRIAFNKYIEIFDDIDIIGRKFIYPPHKVYMHTFNKKAEIVVKSLASLPFVFSLLIDIIDIDSFVEMYANLKP